MRPVTSRYTDPLDQVWLFAAARLGLRVVRDASAYASTDGRGTLRVATAEHLDADDCLAQIILHELCHALVQGGEESLGRPDWGLANDAADPGYDAAREHACLQSQAALLRRHGLRLLLGPTTDFRAYYDALPEDPLGGSEADPSIALAREALGRAARPPFSTVLDEALRATAAIHRALTEQGTPAPGAGEGVVSLWQAAPAPARHRTGLPLPPEGARADRTCGACAWYERRRGAGSSQGMCRRTDGQGTDAAAAACVLHEPAGSLDCRACGACCRAGYDLVPVGRREPVARRHPDLVQREGAHLSLRRAPGENRCAALEGESPGYSCIIYDDRPRACSDLAPGGAHCLTARLRVGLSW